MSSAHGGVLVHDDRIVVSPDIKLDCCNHLHQVHNCCKNKIVVDSW